MAKIDFSDALFLNPASYSTVLNETKKKDALKDRVQGKNPAGLSPKPQFFDVLEETIRETGGPLPDEPASEEALQKLLDNVHSAGDALKTHPFPEEIMRYKQAVRGFIHYIVENGYTVERQTGIPNYLKPGFKGRRGGDAAKGRTSFHVIQVVDRKLEQLAAGILAGQTSQLELLARINEIAGLLVDLLQ
ncbi:MAG: DUF327 family protein [Spirochaetaceae bacterium]|jgi:uncharacterized protein YaaR (DUF327 family)|nr:DUF327 family protein [Spirochaetaceae bacterium]